MKSLKQQIQEGLRLSIDDIPELDENNSNFIDDFNQFIDDLKSVYGTEKYNYSKLKDFFSVYIDELDNGICDNFIKDGNPIAFLDIKNDDTKHIKMYNDIMNFIFEHKSEISFLFEHQTSRSNWSTFVINFPKMIFCITGPAQKLSNESAIIIWQYK